MTQNENSIKKLYDPLMNYSQMNCILRKKCYKIVNENLRVYKYLHMLFWFSS